jgi:hypothetical protein
MRAELLVGATVRCENLPATWRLASSQSVQFRKETPWLSSRITVCNALIAAGAAQARSEQKQRKKEEKSAQRKAERTVEIKSSPDDEKTQ